MMRASCAGTLVAATLIVGALVPAGASPTRFQPVKTANHECVDPADLLLFAVCREYPIETPVRFVADASQSPVSEAGFRAAVAGAVAAWNGAWPLAGPLLSLANGSTNPGFGRDGTNSIGWGNPAKCGAPGAVAVACLWYEGNGGAARHKIVETDIILNRQDTWRIAEGMDLLEGEVYGALGQSPAEWLDVQSVLTHELGHAIGLDDIGNPDVSFPSTLADAGKHLQTMYRWYYRGTTNKRSLDIGDRLGVLVIEQRL